MKIFVQQMRDWNCYAFCAQDVDEPYWDYFHDELWWQLGRHFIKVYDNVPDFTACAEQFARYGETALLQKLRLLPAPWERALDLFIEQVSPLGVDWYVHGSAAMALWGIDVAPRDVNIIFPNHSDFDRVRAHLNRFAIRPIERCDNWVMSGLGELFLEGVVGISFHNQELEPFDMNALGRVRHNGRDIFVSSLDMLKRDNQQMNRPERVRWIEARMGT